MNITYLPPPPILLLQNSRKFQKYILVAELICYFYRCFYISKQLLYFKQWNNAISQRRITHTHILGLGCKVANLCQLLIE